MQAWEDYCQKGPGCGRHPPPPSKAYLISLPEDVLKREGSLALLAELGLDTEVITGIKSVQVGVAAREPPSQRLSLPELAHAAVAACNVLQGKCSAGPTMLPCACSLGHSRSVASPGARPYTVPASTMPVRLGQPPAVTCAE